MSRAVVSGNSADAQYLSVMPSQPLVTLNSKPRPPLPRTGASAIGLVAVLLQALFAEIADQAFMQDVVARDFRGAVARDQRERIERDRRAADIGDVVLDREEIAVVDRDGAAEGEAFAVVVFQRHRVARRQRAGALLLPHRIAVGQPRRRARGSRPSQTPNNRDAPCPKARTARSRANSDRRCRGTASATGRRCVRPSARCCRKPAASRS